GRTAGSPLASFASTVAERLQEEFSAPSRCRRRSLAGGRSYRVGLRALYSDADPKEVRAVVLDGSASIGLGCRFALLYEGQVRVTRSDILFGQDRFALAVRASSFLAYAGRERLRIGAGARGGIVLSD